MTRRNGEFRTENELAARDLSARLSALARRLRAFYDTRPVSRAEWDAASGDERDDCQVVVRFADIGRTPRSGDRVVVLRRSKTGSDFEATVKEYEKDKRGRHVLWPRSSDPDFQEPVVLSAKELPLAGGKEKLPPTVFASSLDEAAEPDITISGLVIGSWRPE